jgi:lipid A 3-O-deacylase
MFESIHYIQSAYVFLRASISFIVSLLFCYQTAKTNLLNATVVLFLSIGSFAANASEQAFAIDYLQGEGDLSGIRLAYRPHHSQITYIEWLGDVDIYWELSVNLWEFGADNQHDSNYALALSPVLSSQFASIANKYPLKWEFGIGVSLVSDTRFAGKDIGSHYQFEDRLGLVLEFGESLKQSIAIRYMHYSNGGLNDKNPGMDFLNVSFAMRF